MAKKQRIRQRRTQGAKRRHKDKELARLRREIEALRAQVATRESKTGESAKTGLETIKRTSYNREQKKQVTTIERVDPKFLKADLIRSAILTIAAIGIIGVFFFIL